jgi:hypothetical protein
MTLEYISHIVESCYYNGSVQDNDKKLELEDFFEMCRAANGSVMRSMWYDEYQKGNVNLYFASAIATDRFPIEKKGRYRVIVLPEGGAVKLPYAMGVMRVTPVMTGFDEDGECGDDGDEYDFEDVFHRGEPGMETSFGSTDLLEDIGERFYIPVGNTLRLFGDTVAPFGEIDWIKNDETLDIPESAAWIILNQVLGTVLKVVGFPLDPTNDGNPNVQTIKQKLADPQGL